MLLARYEEREMQAIWIKSHVYMLRQKGVSGFERDQTDQAMDERFKLMVNAGVKDGKFTHSTFAFVSAILHFYKHKFFLVKLN